MRNLLILPLSAALLAACSTTQESPIYEQSTTYQGDLSTRHQYASDRTVAPTVATYETAPVYTTPAPALPVEAYAAPATVMASSPTDTVYGATEVSGTPGFMAMQNTDAAPTEAYTPAATVMATAPTDSVYSAGDVSGTPGFMAMQQSFPSETVQAATQPLPQAQYVNTAPLGAAGTPIDYDYSRNLVSVDAATTGQRMPETSRIIPSVGQAYTVQQGDTVYSLSRKTCVGVSVIQSMNGLNTDYAIKIGQSITLPASVC